jgi:hypothetical protein
MTRSDGGEAGEKSGDDTASGKEYSGAIGQSRMLKEDMRSTRGTCVPAWTCAGRVVAGHTCVRNSTDEDEIKKWKGEGETYFGLTGRIGGGLA